MLHIIIIIITYLLIYSKQEVTQTSKQEVTQKPLHRIWPCLSFSEVCPMFCKCIVSAMPNNEHMTSVCVPEGIITVVYFIVKKNDIHVCIRNNKVILNFEFVQQT